MGAPLTLEPTVTLIPPRSTEVPEDSLAHLVRRSGAGDVKAFAALYDATAASVYGLALNVLGDDDLACEVLRSAYAEVWRDAPTWSPAHGPVAPWIAVTTHRLAVAHVRTHGTAVPVGPSVRGLLDVPDRSARRRDVA